MRKYRFKLPKRPEPRTKPMHCDDCNCLQKHTLVEVQPEPVQKPCYYVPSWMCNICGRKT